MKIESKKEGKRGKENANLLLREDDQRQLKTKHSLEKDTTANVSEQAATTSNDPKDTATENMVNVKKGIMTKQKKTTIKEELALQQLAEMLSLIPKILRRVVKRSCHAEELIRGGLMNDVTRTNDENRQRQR